MRHAYKIICTDITKLNHASCAQNQIYTECRLYFLTCEYKSQTYTVREQTYHSTRTHYPDSQPTSLFSCSLVWCVQQKIIDQRPKSLAWPSCRTNYICNKCISSRKLYFRGLEVYSIQLYMMKFVRDLLTFPPPIKLTATI